MPNYVQSTPEPIAEQRTQAEENLLRENSLKGLSRRFENKTAIDSSYKIRLEAELQILKNKGYCSYYLIVADYVQWAKENHIAVGPGRGSGPCSLVAYALGITNIDPIKYGLPFERFVNPERKTVPDFDLDFCSDRCGEITSYIQSRYGTDRVAQISSDDTTPLPARLIISNQPLANVVPLYQNPVSGIPATTLNLKQVAAHGLVRFNAIEQKALTVIQRTIDELKKSNIELNIECINLNDKHTYNLLSQGEAFTVTGYDDQLFKHLLTHIQPDDFSSLCATIALHHPNLQELIPQFIKQRQSQKIPGRLHPLLEDYTAETFGIILYQEQFMDIVNQFAGFSLATADSFRRASARSDTEALEQYKCEFINGAASKGLSQAEATKLFEIITQCSPKLFNKSHAVCYALLTYQTAYLEANFPTQFQSV